MLQRATVLAQLAQLLDVPVWGTEQAPERLGALPAELRSRCRQVFAKTAFDACDSGLLAALQAPVRPTGNARSLPKHLQKPAVPARQTVVLAGCEAHVCLLQTALGLLEHELDVWVVTDACGSRRERDRDAAFDRLASSGVELVTDLWFHSLIVLAHFGLGPADVVAELARREGLSGLDEKALRKAREREAAHPGAAHG